MYKDYSKEGLQILGFPCNQFGGQEPDPEEKILEFAKTNYDVQFPLFSKVDVNGPNTCDLYKYLKNNEIFRKQNQKICKDGEVESIPWNFAKFLLNKNGEVVGYYSPKFEPDKIRPAIQQLLSE